MSYRNKKIVIKRLVAASLLFLFCFQAIGLQLTSTVFAEALPGAELKALTQYPNWVGDSCSGGSSSTEDSSVETGTGISDEDIPGKTNEEKIWNYLRSLGFNKKQTAGIVGNIGHEGVYDPQSIQDPLGRTKDYEVFKTLTTTDKGYGLIGFTPGYSLMKPNIGGGADWSGIAKVKVTKDNFYLISTQLDVVYGYMKNTTGLGGGNMLKEFQDASTNVYNATSAFLTQVERPLSPNPGERATTAQKAFEKYGGNPVESITGTGSGASSSSTECCDAAGSTSSALVGSDNEEKVWNYFKNKGLDDHLVAGIMGNISQESGFDPKIVQGGGQSEDPSSVSSGYGLIQWTPGSKLIGIAEQAKITGKLHELGTQLDIIWWHLNNTAPPGGSHVIEEFKKAGTPKEAATKWEELMEAAGDPQMENRWAAAEAAMDEYSGSGGGGGGSSSSSSSGGSSCTCETSGGKTVVLDPGHSGSDITEDKDPSGVVAFDYYNKDETEDMWQVSQKITKKLEDKGYTVINTKKSAKDTVGLIARAKVANNANAALAVSLHSTGGTFGSKSVGWVIPQEKGLYRQSGSHKKVFQDGEVAKTSREYANKILEERKKSEGDAQIHGLDFAGRDLPATGNISIVQLFSKVPWVYNEVGQTGFNANKYAEGISQGIISALGASDAGDSASTSCSGGGDLISTLKAYAWPEYHAAPYLERKPAWAAVADNPQSHYVGGSVSGVKGIDCGGFVTMLMRNSGIDPNYNSGKGATGSASDPNTQWGYLDKNWTKVNASSTKDLKPGDVAINSTHTFVHVGKVDGFSDVFASASYSTSGNGRAPMAGGDDISSYTWYRKN